jgi:DNA-binding transcriptional ArsR family regulator
MAEYSNASQPSAEQRNHSIQHVPPKSRPKERYHAVREDRQKLPADVARTLAPGLRRALDHPTRRRILRSLNVNGGAQTLESLSDVAPNSSVSTIRYHALVLEECGGVSVSVALFRSGGSGPHYASNVADNRMVMEALRATRQLDDESDG